MVLLFLNAQLQFDIGLTLWDIQLVLFSFMNEQSPGHFLVFHFGCCMSKTEGVSPVIPVSCVAYSGVCVFLEKQGENFLFVGRKDTKIIFLAPAKLIFNTQHFTSFFLIFSAF